MTLGKTNFSRVLRFSLLITILVICFGTTARGDAPSGWGIVDEGESEGPSIWSESKDVITQTSNIYGGAENDPEKPGTFAVTGDAGWTDYTLRLDMRSADDDAIGVIFRYRNPNNYYRFSMDRQRAYRRLIKKSGGRVTILAEDAFVYVQDKWYRVKIEAIDDNIKIFLDNRLVFEVFDDSLPQGRIGLYCWGNAVSEFAGVRVTDGETALFPAPAPIAKPTSFQPSPVSKNKDTAALKAGISKNREQKIPREMMTSVQSVAAAPAVGLSSTTKIPESENRSAEIQPVKADRSYLPTDSQYVIGPGDVIAVSVWRDEALSRVATVLPDGTITLPLIDRIAASGKTVLQLQRELSAKIAEYIPDPVVTVMVEQTTSMMIYVIGKVNNPGRFPIVSNINVLQALSLAGGFNPFAKKDRIKIYRHAGHETKIIDFNYDEVADGKKLEQNIQLQKSDVILVP